MDRLVREPIYHARQSRVARQRWVASKGTLRLSLILNMPDPNLKDDMLSRERVI
jgi:hypothetical protein